MDERKEVRQFTLDTEIHDAELPQKIHEALAADLPSISPEHYYDIDIVFDKSVYSKPEFYRYALDKPLAPPPQGRRGKVEAEWQKELLSVILSQQLDKVVKQIEPLEFDIGMAGIIGDELVGPCCVKVQVYEGRVKEYDKKGKLKKHPKIFSIMPDRPYITEQAAKLFARLIDERMREDAKKKYELSRHTPNMVKADKLFYAVAQAMLLESKEGGETEIAKLTDKLRAQARIISDWPLEIESVTKAEAQVNPITPESEIDCPRYLLYHAYQGGHWDLKKIENLKAAQYIITKDGYNLKRTAFIGILHELKPVPFTLMEETEEGLVMLEKEQAAGKKKLQLCWNK